jgi:hypothetical protein
VALEAVAVGSSCKFTAGGLAQEHLVKEITAALVYLKTRSDPVEAVVARVAVVWPVLAPMAGMAVLATASSISGTSTYYAGGGGGGVG